MSSFSGLSIDSNFLCVGPALGNDETNPLKVARKRMYQELRVKYPNADKQVIKNMAYDLTREAVNNLSGSTWVFDSVHGTWNEKS